MLFMDARPGGCCAFRAGTASFGLLSGEQKIQAGKDDNRQRHQYDNQAEENPSFFNCWRPADEQLYACHREPCPGAAPGKEIFVNRAARGNPVVCIRHGQPVRAMKRIASTASPKHVVGARRRGFSAGNSDSITRHSGSIASNTVAKW